MGLRMLNEANKAVIEPIVMEEARTSNIFIQHLRTTDFMCLRKVLISGFHDLRWVTVLLFAFTLIGTIQKRMGYIPIAELFLLIVISTWALCLVEKKTATRNSLILQGIFTVGIISVYLYIISSLSAFVDQFINIFDGITGLKIFGILAYSFAVATSEEIAFRKLLLDYLNERMPTFWAVLLSGIAFWSIHATFLPGLLFLSIVMGYFVLRYKSLITVVAIHFLYDVIGLLILTSRENMPSDNSIFDFTEKLRGAFVLTLFICGMLFVFFIIISKIIQRWKHLVQRRQDILESNGPGPD